MIELFASLRHFVRFRDARCASFIFRLYHPLTVVILIAASLLATSTQYVGKPIHCAYNKNLFSEEYVNSFCWANATYYHPHDPEPDPLQAAPHVRPGRGPGDNVQHLGYYQWVPFVLFFQAVLFYTPWMLWKGFEGGLMTRLLATSDRTDDEKACVARLSTFMCHNSSSNNLYMYRYFFCELLALLSVIGQMFLLNRFFDGMFLFYGLRTLEYFNDDAPSNLVNPMIQLFPRITKCTLQAYAFNGNLDVIEALCVLPVNVLNEKVFLFEWFWFAFLAVVSAIQALYRLLVLVSPKLQQRLFRAQLGFADRKVLDRIFKKTSRGDWFVLQNLAHQADFVLVAKVLHDMDRRMHCDEGAVRVSFLERGDSKAPGIHRI